MIRLIHLCFRDAYTGIIHVADEEKKKCQYERLDFLFVFFLEVMHFTNSGKLP